MKDRNGGRHGVVKKVVSALEK